MRRASHVEGTEAGKGWSLLISKIEAKRGGEGVVHPPVPISRKKEKGQASILEATRKEWSLLSVLISRERGGGSSHRFRRQ